MQLKRRDRSVLGYEDLGDGDALVLLHAFPLDRRMWEPQSILARGTRLVLVDFRGFGDSTGTGSIEDAADDVTRVLDHLGIERAVVGGLSMGGYVALAFARRHARRLAGLLLADTRASADDEAGRAARDEAITTVVRGGLDDYLETLVPRLVSGKHPKALDKALGIAHVQSEFAVVGALAALRDRPDATAGLARIAVPTTVVVGSDDTLTPPPVARAMAAAIKGAVLVEIPDAGHLANLEAPSTFNDALDQLMYRAKK